MRILAVVFVLLGSVAEGQEIRPHFDQPVQADKYIIRPGDQLTITLLRANIEPLKLTVDPEGRIIHSNLGMFDLSHKTLVEAKEILRTAVKSQYKVESVVISITDPLLVSFSVTGAVAEPGFYQGYTSQRVSDAVKMAGGITRGGSSRRIQFIGGPHEINVDLDRARSTGDLQYDPSLYMGYKILIPQKSNSRIQITGEVNHPKEIELLPGDDLNLLILLAGGFRSWADSNNIEIIRGGRIENAREVEIESGDIIKVRPLDEIAEFQTVAIFGAVGNPGRFRADGAATLGDLLKLSGGYDNRAVKERLAVFRYSPLDASGRLSMVRIPIQNIWSVSSSESDFTLQAGDSVFVPFSVGFVEVAGQVLNPGIFPFEPDKSVEFYINRAGGFLPDAERTQIGVFDIITRLTSQVTPKVKIYDGFRIIVDIRKELQ